MKNKFFTLIFTPAVILASLFMLFQISPTSLSSEKIRFVIGFDTKMDDIVSQLENEHFIRSKPAFNLFTSILDPFGKIEPGAYLLSRNMILFEIINTLYHHPYQKWVIIPPGLRVEQTAQKISDKLNWTDGMEKEFLQNAREGMMFPDSYLINTDATGKEAAQKLISNFNEKFDAKIQKDLLSQDVKNDTAIKIASLIERESGGDEDKGLIAGIIWNRLLKGMRLQIDATIQYAKGEPGNWWPKISLSDYKHESEYNTYLIGKLPPSPICSPGLASIKAVAYPADTKCLYYLHDKNKQIHCAQTYEEHKENIEKYLR